MNIVLATDNNFVQHCCVTIASILFHNADVHFYIFTEGLSDENSEILSKQVNKMGGKVNFCKIDSSIINSFPMPTNAGDHITIATYYRLLVENILPSTIKKILYLDCDVVCRGSLKDLWDINLNNYALGAVYQSYNSESKNDLSRLEIDEKDGYFNAGVLLVNLDYWRTNKVTARLLSFVENKYSSIKQHDQDCLNAVLYKEVKPISYIWNYLPLFWFKGKKVFPDKVNYEKLDLEPVIVHYVSTPKPWEIGCDNPYKKEYYKYLSMTSYSGWKPSFKLKRYLKYVIKPKVVRILCIIDFLKIRKILS